jgi:integral membrane protein
MNLNTPLGQLRILALFEGISYLIFGITMPLKYVFEIPEPNKVIGMFHGILFIAYVVSAMQNWLVSKWSLRTIFFVMAASIVPFGTFVLETRVLKPMANQRG